MRLLTCLTAAAALFLSLAHPALGAPKEIKTANDTPVTLSPFEVVANTVEFKAWKKFSSEHFILYTDSGEKDSVRLLRNLEMLRLVEMAFFLRRPLALSRIVIVMPTSSSDWRKIASKGSVQWQVATSSAGWLACRSVLVQYDWDEDGAGLVQCSVAKIVLDDIDLTGPLWFTTGIGRFFETAEFNKDKVTIGRENPGVLALRAEGWLEWPVFFAVNSSSPEFTQERSVQRYVGQCTAFVQYLLTNKEPAWVDRLLLWDALMDAGAPPNEADFKANFGQDWPTWQKTMEHYLSGGEYVVKTYTLPPDVAQTPVTRHDLKAREMRDLFVLAQIQAQNIPASDAALDSILASGLKTSGLREMLIEACHERGRPDVVVAKCRELIAEGSTNAGVYATAADVLFWKDIRDIKLTSNIGEDGPQIEAWCRQALAIEPLLEPANATLAWTLALKPKPSTQDLADIKSICKRMSGVVVTSPMFAALAMAHRRSGDPKYALHIADALLKSKYTAKRDRRLAEQLIQDITGIPAATVPIPLSSDAVTPVPAKAR